MPGVGGGPGVTLGQALTDLDAGQFVGRQGELDVFGRWLADGHDIPAILNVTGPGGIGKTTLLRAFRREAVGAGYQVALVDGRSVTPSADGILAALGASDVAGAVERINARPTLLAFDSFDELSAVTRFLQEELLSQLDASVRVVLVSRNALGLAWREMPWGNAVRRLALQGLAEPEVDRYLELRGVPAGRRDEVTGAAMRHPLALTLAADLVVQLGIPDLGRAPEWRLAVRQLVTRMTEHAAGNELGDLLEAAAVVRHFDEAMLAAVAGHEDITASFGRLCRLSVVQAGSRGLMLHDDVPALRHRGRGMAAARAPDAAAASRLRAPARPGRRRGPRRGCLARQRVCLPHGVADRAGVDLPHRRRGGRLGRPADTAGRARPAPPALGGLSRERPRPWASAAAR